MAITTTKLTSWCGFSRGGVQDVEAFRVAQSRIVPFFSEDIDTKLE